MENYEKKYKDALERARKCWGEYNELVGAYENKGVCEEIFPELAESEDERIRKRLISYFKSQVEAYGDENHEVIRTYNKWIAWLENQGEHKKFRDSIQVGDKVTKNEDGVLVNLSQLKRVAKKDEQILANSAKTCKDEQKPTDVRTTGYWHVEDVEQKPAKVEPKFKIGDRVIGIVSGMQYYITEVCDDYYYTESGCTIMFYAQDNFELYKQKPVEWSEEDEGRFNNLCFLINQSDENVPTKEGFINWLKSFCHHKHNHTSWWYECIKECVGFKVGNVYNSDGEWIYGDNKKCAYDERFFHPQSHWKPSDEQMEALESATENCAYSEYQDCLRELIEQLKKLKG